MDIKKSDTAIQNVYLSDSWKKRTIQNNPAASFCSFLTLPGMSGSPPLFSDYLYFYSFMDRNVHAHFYRQPISIDCQVLFIFFFSGRCSFSEVFPLRLKFPLRKSFPQDFLRSALISCLSKGFLSNFFCMDLYLRFSFLSEVSHLKNIFLFPFFPFFYRRFLVSFYENGLFS